MSRALDCDTIRLLSTSSIDAALVYDEVSEALDPAPDGSLLEIELLSGVALPPPGESAAAHSQPQPRYLLREDNAVAIPKFRLLQAFFVARKTLAEARDCSDTCVVGGAEEKNVAQKLRRAAGVALLMDAENLTAANVRKRLLQAALEGHECKHKKNTHQQRHHPDNNAEGLAGTRSSLLQMLQREVVFVDSLLTSHLHRHTKSPTLWSHRRWLVEASMAYELAVDMGLDVTEQLRTVVLVSAVRHPRNYYAWNHARWLVERGLLCRGGAEERRNPIHADTAAGIVQLIKEWCFRNHSDISGWSFLYFMGRVLREEGRREAAMQTMTALFNETLGLAVSLGWANESVWVFLRTMVACSDLVHHEAVSAFELAIEQRLKPQQVKSRRSQDLKAIESAMAWYRRFGKRDVDCT